MILNALYQSLSFARRLLDLSLFLGLEVKSDEVVFLFLSHVPVIVLLLGYWLWNDHLWVVVNPLSQPVSLIELD